MFKPQSAFFERHGSRGIAVLERVIADARDAGALVLLDAKRGDLGSTMQGYADAYLDPRSPLFVDAITVTPYLGFGSLQPMIDTATANGAGVFVVALTSNPEAPQFQHAVCADGRTVGATVLAEVGACNEGVEPMGSVGAVVGATLTEPVPGPGRPERAAARARDRHAGRPTGGPAAHLRRGDAQRGAVGQPRAPRGRAER